MDKKNRPQRLQIPNEMKAAKSFLGEFKVFIAKGNVVDLAVGVIIGGAFGKIVSSLVSDIVMPLIGVLLGGLDLTNLSITIGSAKLTYGNFLQNIVGFVIIAASIFLFVKIINGINPKTKKEEVEKVDEQLEVLKEIRNELKKTDKTSR